MEHYLGVTLTFFVVILLVQQQVKTGKCMLHICDEPRGILEIGILILPLTPPIVFLISCNYYVIDATGICSSTVYFANLAKILSF